MYIKPAEGRAPRDPYTMMRVPPEGQHAPDLDMNWLTLLRMGDVVESAEPSTPPDPEQRHSTLAQFHGGDEEHA